MDRRTAIKVISVMGASVFVPSILLDMGRTESDIGKWFEDNLPWLMNWFNKEPLVRGHFEGMQIFKSVVEIMGGKFKVNQGLATHKIDILRAAVFSKGGVYTVPSAEGDLPIRNMSGFYDQTGRLPEVDDEVRFHQLVQAWFKCLDTHELGFERRTWVTECKLEVI